MPGFIRELRARKCTEEQSKQPSKFSLSVLHKHKCEHLNDNAIIVSAIQVSDCVGVLYVQSGIKQEIHNSFRHEFHSLLKLEFLSPRLEAIQVTWPTSS